jgi:FAD/FMN-containing dehydrogenase
MSEHPFIAQAREVVGTANVLTHDLDAYAVDWKEKYHGQPMVVVRPGNTAEVAAVVRLCAQHRLSIVPQGGNTGMCGAATPDASGQQVIITLGRLNKVRAVDPANNTMTVEAGCVLQTLQETAESVNRLYPLSVGSEGSCQIGGNIATNAGGVQVLRYGNTRDLVLGLEVVLPSGEVLDMLRGLRKDNTGYDLKHLFIGSEGTLGLITAATLKLMPLPSANAVGMVAVESPAKAVELLQHMRDMMGERFSAFELMSNAIVELTRTHFPALPQPFAEQHDWYVLMEVADGGSDAALTADFQSALEQALERELVLDVVITQSQAQARALWELRDNVSEAQQHDAPNIKHDISLPVSQVPRFIDEVSAELAATFPGSRLFCFGHLGDGNLHFNLSRPLGTDNALWLKKNDAVNDIVHAAVARFNGSISAEHGIGQQKVDELPRYKSALELEVMRTIKRALDPLQLMNPGKVLR